MRMHGNSKAYRDAQMALKIQLVKGAVFKDSKGRTLMILDVPKFKNQAITVEVTTLSTKQSEKRGKAKITMYEPTKKKKTTVLVNLFSGLQYVFVKTVMEDFIKPFIDSLISEPDEDPMKQYRVVSVKKKRID